MFACYKNQCLRGSTCTMDTPGKKTFSSELKQNTFTVLKKTFFMNQVLSCSVHCQLTDLVIPRIGFELERGLKMLPEGWDVKYSNPIYSQKH